MPLPGLHLILALGGIIVAAECGVSFAQRGDTSPVIKVESHEVVLPIEVFEQKKNTGVVVGPNREAQLGGWHDR